MRPVLIALVVCAVWAPASRADNVRHFEDAALQAVQFLDQDEGWAVGDAGAIWHTINGGRDWERVPAPTQASLRSVHFLNPYVGWIVGREELGEGKGSVGVLLYTKDGGLKWYRLLNNALPGLNQVRFASSREGFVLGDGSDQYPSGAFKTVDGGRSWLPVKGPRSPGWLAGDFQDGKTGALVGAWGRLAKMRHETLGTADVEALGGRNLRGVQLRANRAIAVGDGGAILVSRTSGSRWGYVTPESLKLSREVLASLDFRSVHCVGDRVWVVGRPGTVVLHSPDLGATWQVQKTGQPVPLNGVFFQDEQRGWAVGELGSILATIDGGKTWTVQRRGGQRAAALFVNANSTGIPLDAVAFLGGEEGYLTAVLRVGGPDPASASMRHAASWQRVGAASRQASGAAGEMLWQLPLPQHLAHASKKEVLDSWNRLHANRADKQLLRQLVLALRTWRPDVVVTDHPDAEVTGSAAEALVAEAVHEAFREAADPRAFPEQLTVLDLKPWSVSKVYARWHERQGAQVVLSLGDVRRRLESSLGDFIAPARAILTDQAVSLPEERYFRLVDSRIPSAASQKGLMDGVNSGQDGRRKLDELPEPRPEIVKAMRARRAFEILARRPASELINPSKTLALIGPALARLPEDQAANAIYAVASQYAREGQWVMAREAFILMVERYPAHPHAADAYRWLIRHNSSSEARRRHEMGQFLVLTKSFPKPEGGAAQEGAPTGGRAEERTRVYLNSQEETRAWYKSSLEIGHRLAAFGPVYIGDPSIQFCLQAARRRLGELDAAQRWYTEFKDHHPDDPWRAAAAAELWLNNRIGPSPKPAFACRETAVRPLLDGKLEDNCWTQHKPMVLKNAVAETAKDYPTEAWLSYDQEFLYLAVRCRHPEGKYVAPVKPRKRDADLRPYDRISLLLDLDRDYSTCFHLQVDQRGCVFDDCWGDKSWNPRWFVAVHSDKTSWQLEAAIPLVELTSDRVRLGTAWAFNVVRTLPGRGVQAWSTPADVQPRPEGMGLLIFAQDAQQAPKVAQGRPVIPKVP